MSKAWLSAFLLLPFFVGCQAETPELEPAVGKEVVAIAQPAAAELMRTLVGRLTAAMEEGGPGAAIEFCSSEALPLTANIEAGLQEGLSLKRTSYRYRNPLNAPDGAEEEALLYFENAVLEGGPPPGSYVHQVSEEEYRYYQPLFLGEFCLQCHGDRENMLPEVLTALDGKYPTDLATGYEVGDFRGVLRVSVPASVPAVQKALELRRGTEG